MIRLVGLLALSVASFSCGSPLSPTELTRLAVSEQRWASRGFADYSIETLASCFCPSELTTWARIEVVNGQVHRATLLATGEVITDSRLAYWHTVEELFASIRRANDDESLTDIRVSYDATLGFPTSVTWIPEEGILDAGGSQTLRNAHALP